MNGNTKSINKGFAAEENKNEKAKLRRNKSAEEIMDEVLNDDDWDFIEIERSDIATEQLPTSSVAPYTLNDPSQVSNQLHEASSNLNEVWWYLEFPLIYLIPYHVSHRNDWIDQIMGWLIIRCSQY